MGPWCAVECFIKEIKAKASISKVEEITAILYGSLAKTGLGHGTDVAIMMGLLGENFITTDTSKIFQKVEEIKKSKTLHLNAEKIIPFEYEKNIIFNFAKSLDFHPNGMTLSADLETVSYTHLRAHETRSKSRMPSSA